MRQELGPLAKAGSRLLPLPEFWLPAPPASFSVKAAGHLCGEGRDRRTAKGTESSQGALPPPMCL